MDRARYDLYRTDSFQRVPLTIRSTHFNFPEKLGVNAIVGDLERPHFSVLIIWVTYVDHQHRVGGDEWVHRPVDGRRRIPSVRVEVDWDEIWEVDGFAGI